MAGLRSQHPGYARSDEWNSGVHPEGFSSANVSAVLSRLAHTPQPRPHNEELRERPLQRWPDTHATHRGAYNAQPPSSGGSFSSGSHFNSFNFQGAFSDSAFSTDRVQTTSPVRIARSERPDYKSSERPDCYTPTISSVAVGSGMSTKAVSHQRADDPSHGLPHANSKGPPAHARSNAPDAAALERVLKAREHDHVHGARKSQAARRDEVAREQVAVKLKAECDDLRFERNELLTMCDGLREERDKLKRQVDNTHAINGRHVD